MVVVVVVMVVVVGQCFVVVSSGGHGAVAMEMSSGGHGAVAMETVMVVVEMRMRMVRAVVPVAGQRVFMPAPNT